MGFLTVLAMLKRFARALLAVIAALTLLVVSPALAMRVSPMLLEM